MRLKFSVFGILLAVFVGFSLSPVSAASGDLAARTVVEKFHDVLLGTMKDGPTLGIKGRYERLEPTIEEFFDLSLMIRVATGRRSWVSSPQGKRNDLRAAFKHMSVSTYASQFKSFSGQTFEIHGVRPGHQGTLLVATRISNAEKDSSYKLTYVLKESRDRGGKWGIADVLLDATISQLAVRRSEYNRILKNEGVDALIATLNERANKLLTE